MKKRLLYLCASLMVCCCLWGCKTKPDINNLAEYHALNSEVEISKNKLNSELNLYIDCSTCVADAVKNNSPLYQAMHASIIDADPNLWLIKGSDISLCVSKDIKNSKDKIYREIKSISEINYADIKSAAEQIAEGNSQAILITDGEYYQKGISGDYYNFPYMADAIKKWIGKGFDIYIYVENYKENNKYSKHRYYIIFTDEDCENNIHNILDKEIKLGNGNISKDYKCIHLTSEFKVEVSTNNKEIGSALNGNKKYTVVDYDWSLEDMMEYAGYPEGKAKAICNIKLSPNDALVGVQSLLCKSYDITNDYIINDELIYNAASKPTNGNGQSTENGDEETKFQKYVLPSDDGLFYIKGTSATGEFDLYITDNIYKGEWSVYRIDIFIDGYSNDKIKSMESHLTWKSISKGANNMDNISLYKSVEFGLSNIIHTNDKHQPIHTVNVFTKN